MRFADVPESPWPAYQNAGEFGQLWELVASRPHARVLEIGSLFGGTLWAWAHLPAIEMLVSIDLPTDWAPIRAEVLEARQQWGEAMSPLVEFRHVECDSHDPPPMGATAIDFLFIDGDHSYEGVRADWLVWSPVVRPGGIVAFHDTSAHGTSVEPGVVRWVDELRHHLPSIEWTDPDGVGICAFQLP